MYQQESNWRDLQDLLPEENKITEALMPHECFREVCGYKLHIDEYAATGSSNICIVMFHGVGGNGRLLSYGAVPLAREGYEVVCPDLPGYGFTEHDTYPDYEDWISVGEQLAREKLAEKKKVILFGLSAGGMLAYNVACKVPEVSGLIVTNILDNRLPVVRQHSAKNRLQANLGLPLLKLLPSFFHRIQIPISWVTNMNALVNDRRILKRLLKDKRGAGNKVQLGFLSSMMESVPILEPEDFTDVPALLCHPGDDRWTPTEISELFFDRIQAQTNKVILENCGHFPIEMPGRQLMESQVKDFIKKVSML